MPVLTDPLADLDAFITQMNNEMTDLGTAEIDWDQFLVDHEDRDSDNEATAAGPMGTAKSAFFGPASPASCDSLAATPKSTESEQSQALDPKDDDFDLFDFGLAGPGIGLMHEPEHIAAPPAYQSLTLSAPAQFTAAATATATAAAPSASTSNFTGAFGDFGGLLDLTNPTIDLGLADFVAKFAPSTATQQPEPEQPAATVATVPAPTQTVDLSDALQQAYASLGWTGPSAGTTFSPLAPAPVAIEPAQLVLPTVPAPAMAAAPSLKRKESDAGSDSSASVPVKRPRGRPPKVRTDSASASATPKDKRQASVSVRAGSIDSEGGDIEAGTSSGDASVRRTASGKPSTARPKSVVPEKYFKDGTAQAITGMTMEQILAFPTFEELLKQVEPSLRPAAAEFGERIAENRDKAKDAAKKSREERKAKIDTLERTVEDLEDKIKGMQGVLLALVAKGVVAQADVEAFFE